MAIFSKKDTASSFPVDETIPFNPKRALYIHQPTEFTLSTTIADVTAVIAPTFSSTPSSPDTTIFETAKSAASQLSPIIQITRPNRLTRTWAVRDGDGTPLAELSNPLWSLGKWTIKFPAESPHSGHDIQLRPAGPAARADEFVKDSVPYFWDSVDGRKLCRLYRAMDGKKVEVARFLGEHATSHEGILLVSEGIDDVVVALTVFGVLNRVESFRA